MWRERLQRKLLRRTRVCSGGLRSVSRGWRRTGVRLAGHRRYCLRLLASPYFNIRFLYLKTSFQNRCDNGERSLHYLEMAQEDNPFTVDLDDMDEMDLQPIVGERGQQLR